MLKKAIIRPWWGNRQIEDEFSSNRILMEHTLKFILNDKYKVPFITYVFGKDNYNFLKSNSLEDLVLVNSNPNPRSNEHMYIHRLDLCKAALCDFDEIVCLNWNCRLIKEFDNSFWDILSKKESLQLPLMKTRISIVTNKYRTGRQTKIFPNDSFCYFRDKLIVDGIIKLLDDPDILVKWTPESLVGNYIDNFHKKWIGIDKYRELYEPEVVTVSRGVFSQGKDAFFRTNKKLKRFQDTHVGLKL